MNMRATSSSIAIIASLMSAPAMAQSANDFQLPPAPTPTNTPSVEGPVDDSGIVPVGPRAAPAPTRTPTPAPANAPTTTLPSVLTPTPTPTGAATPRAGSQPNVQPIGRPAVQPTRSSNRPAAPGTRTAPAAPNTRRTPQPLPGRTLTPLEESDGTPSGPAAAPAATGTAPTTSAAPTAPVADTAQDNAQNTDASPLPAWAIWAAGGAAALLALILGLAWWRRKQIAPPAELMAVPHKAPITELDGAEPETIAPLAGVSDVAAAVHSDLKLNLEIEQLSRSMMMMTLKCRVTLANRSDKAARDVSIAADLVSANRGLPMDAQVATATAFLPSIGEASRIGPHKTQSFPATITLPIQQLAAFNHSNKPMFVPLVRVRMDTKDAEPEFYTFAVGIAADPSLTASTKLQPVPLDGIPGSYENVRSRRLDNPA